MTVNQNVRDLLFSDATLALGELHWTILKAARTMDRERWKRVDLEFGSRYDDTDLGREIGMDEIHWWIFEKESDPDALLARSKDTLEKAQVLKVAAANLGRIEPDTYEALVLSLRDFAEKHRNEVFLLRDYVKWLASRNLMAPRILFTYRVWGSTRMSDRDFDVDNEPTPNADVNKLREIVEIVLGLKRYGWPVYERVEAELAYEMFENMAPEEWYEEPVVAIPERRVVKQAAREVYAECAIYFSEIRDSLRNIVLDIVKMKEQEELFQSDKFWRDFIHKAVVEKTGERQLWDFKETLTVWHVKNEEERRKAKVTFAEDIASFANTSGGLLIIGVDDKRRIVGIGDGKDVENRLKVARDVLAAHIDYRQDLASFRQVAVDTEHGEKACLVVVIAQACLPVAVNDGNGRFSFPVRRETGINRVGREDVPVLALHLKSDNRDFMRDLSQFVRERQGN
jgi:hypothetical protein